MLRSLRSGGAGVRRRALGALPQASTRRANAGWSTSRHELWREKRNNREENFFRPKEGAGMEPGWTDESAESRRASREVRSLGQQGLWEEALAVMEQVEEPGGWLRQAVMSACARASKLDKVEQLFEEAPRKDASVYSQYINSCGVRNPERLRNILQEIRGSNIEPDVRVYGALMNAHSRVHDTQRALDYYEEAKSAGLKLGGGMYQTVLSACIRGGSIDLASKTIAEMEAAGVEPQLQHLSSMIACCSRSKDEATARQWFQRIRDKGFAPDAIAYTNLLSSLSGPGHFERALDLFEQLKAEGNQPDSFLFNAMLRLAVENKNVEKFKELLADMDARGLKRNRETEYRLQEFDSMQKHMALRDLMSSATQRELERAEAPPQWPQAADVQLPPGWCQAVDPGSGHTYYWQASDPAATTTWTRPTA